MVVFGPHWVAEIVERIWLMNTTLVLDWEVTAESLRIAWDINRACNPTWGSPIAPAISASGTRAATESTTMMSIAPLRTRCSVISKACSPELGWESSRCSISTPIVLA